MPVIAAILRPQFRETLAGTQTLDLRQREIFGKPARHGFAVDDLRTAPRRKAKMLRDIGGAADLILMTCDEHPVARHDQIRLDVVGTLLDRQPVRFQGVFRPFPARAAMGNDDNFGHEGSEGFASASLSHTQGGEAP